MIVAEGVAFGEGPRWHDGTLWWSDMHGHEVCRLVDGETRRICAVPQRPSGLGWLPDGRLLVVSMTDRRVLRMQPDGALVTHADLSGLAPRRCNDMTVDRRGRAYVGNFGFELHPAETPRPTVLVRVDPDGSAHVAAEDLWFPNGMAITDDGAVLIVAETWAQRLTAVDIEADRGQSNPRVWAQLPDDFYPDGICLDAQGAAWVASPARHGCGRVREGGELLQWIDTGRSAFACMLGGDDRRTLFVCTADSHDPERQRAERNGRIEVFPVEAPGAGLP